VTPEVVTISLINPATPQTSSKVIVEVKPMDGLGVVLGSIFPLEIKKAHELTFLTSCNGILSHLF
jgi:hypothetical protein